jgi:hypothetical protein
MGKLKCGARVILDEVEGARTKATMSAMKCTGESGKMLPAGGFAFMTK